MEGQLVTPDDENPLARGFCLALRPLPWPAGWGREVFVVTFTVTVRNP